MDMQPVNQKGQEDGLGAAWEVEDAADMPKVGPVSKAFLLAGKAHFTAENLTSGQRFTFRISKVEPEEGSPYKTPCWFAGLLTGPDNEHHYDYLGMVLPQGLELRLTKASKRPEGDQAVRVLRWVLKLVENGGPIPKGYAIHHEGKCGRCGRLLTVPSSIAAGLGPECVGKV